MGDHPTVLGPLFSGRWPPLRAGVPRGPPSRDSRHGAALAHARPPEGGEWGPSLPCLPPGLSAKLRQDTGRAGAVLYRAEISNHMLGTRT